MSLLKVSDLEISFVIRGKTLRIIDKIDFSLSKGETFVIVGESGCGKSAFAMSLVGILPHNARISGSALYKGQDLFSLDHDGLQDIRGREIGFVPQSSSTCLNPVLRIDTQFRQVLRQGPSRVESGAAIDKLLDSLCLEKDVARMYPHQLSEGIKGRVLIGLGVCRNPMLIVADEPTKGLDGHSKKGVLEMFSNILSQGDRSLLMITHDFEVAGALPGRLGIMYAGEFVECGPTGNILAGMQSHPYTLGLLRSLPQRDFQPLPGRCVSLQERQTTGCRFANRCSMATSVCHERHPLLELVANDHWVRCFHA